MGCVVVVGGGTTAVDTGNADGDVPLVGPGPGDTRGVLMGLSPVVSRRVGVPVRLSTLGVRPSSAALTPAVLSWRYELTGDGRRDDAGLPLDICFRRELMV